MNRPAEPIAATPDPARSRAWVGWTIVGVAAAALIASFWIAGGEDAPEKQGGGPRVAAVGVAPVVREAITQRGRYPGELVADAADIAAYYAGRVKQVHVRIGDSVENAQVLVELDPVDAREQIAQARAQAKAAAAEQRKARVERDAALAEVARLEPLARDKLISGLEIDRQRARAQALAVAVEAAAAGETEATARVKLLEKRVIESAVRAPFAGRIAARYVDPGVIVSAGDRLVRVVQVAPLRVRFEVPEHEVAQLAVGTPLRVVTGGSRDGTGPKPAAEPGISAKVSGIGSEVSRERRVANVEAVIEAPPAGWLPGMYAEAVVDLRTLEQATTVPASAVLSRLLANGTVSTGVFVATGDTARWTAVREVTRDGDRVAVEGELAPGAQVLVAGHVDLPDGAKIMIAKPSEQPAEQR